MKKAPASNCWGFVFGAGDESRTRDLNLGKVALYQLSYSRMHNTCVLYQASNYNSALSITRGPMVGLGHLPLGKSNQRRTSSSKPTPCMKL